MEKENFRSKGLKKMRSAIILTPFNLLIKIVGGIFTKRSALLCDAGYLFGDFFALGLGWADFLIAFFLLIIGENPRATWFECGPGQDCDF